MDAHRKTQLQELIKSEFRGNNADFLEAAKISKGYLSQLLDPSKPFGERAAKSLVEKLGLEPGFFEKGGQESSNTEPGPDIKSRGAYPVISFVQAGSWTDLCDNFQPGDADDWRQSHKNLGKCGYMLRVAGKSMTAAEGSAFSFPEGMLLHINPDMQPIPGQFVIVRRESENQATFKKLVMVDGEQYLEALNPDWPNRYLKLQEGDHFCGVVVHAGFDMP